MPDRSSSVLTVLCLNPVLYLALYDVCVKIDVLKFAVLLHAALVTNMLSIQPFNIK